MSHLHLLRFTLLLLVPVCIAWGADEARWSAEMLSSWVGRYPTTISNGKKLSILDEPQIKSRLEHILPSYERRSLAAYRVETPVRQMERFVVVNRCKAHNCPSELAMIVIDLDAARLWAMFYSRQTGRTSARWYSNGDDISVLPSDIIRDFAARHGSY